jgi:hypothetical protein
VITIPAILADKFKLDKSRRLDFITGAGQFDLTLDQMLKLYEACRANVNNTEINDDERNAFRVLTRTLGSDIPRHIRNNMSCLQEYLTVVKGGK